MIQLTQEALLALIHDASTRAAAQTMAQFCGATPQQSTPFFTSSKSRIVLGYWGVGAEAGGVSPPIAATHGSPPSKGVQDPSLALVVAPPRCSPFSAAILAEALPAGVKVSNPSEYDETGDPQEHLDKIYAKIDCLEQLTQRFLHHFSMNKRVPKIAAFLFTIRQKENEPLTDYMQRFVEAVHEVPHVNHELLASIIQQNMLPGRFKESIAGKPPNTMEDLLMRSQKYIRIEESNVSDPSPGVKRKDREEEKEPKKKEECKHVPPTGVIAVISGDPAGGDSANARKALVRATRGNYWQDPIQDPRGVEVGFTTRHRLEPSQRPRGTASSTSSSRWASPRGTASSPAGDLEALPRAPLSLRWHPRALHLKAPLRAPLPRAQSPRSWAGDLEAPPRLRGLVSRAQLLTSRHRPPQGIRVGSSSR
ncbi:UNVERIFIED_CONTAM: hypothetical protein Sradi_6508200 [Sesamum radiatum]|uniref:Retrotransposon gag domain-containing protein n=1 Tax=Sesamum radiatum TaxID=300843 RepID=A0AAW2JVE7_SESRA